MRLVRPSFEILRVMGSPSDETGISREHASMDPVEFIEAAGRTCYKSEDKITEDSARKFVGMLVDRGHHSVIEHSAMTVKFIIDRGVSHELVRHRLCAFSQESTRYCNYKEGGVTFVIPPWLDIKPCNKEPYWYEYPPYMPWDAQNVWYASVQNAEMEYLELLRRGWTPQQARSVLPNSLKTEIVVTANFREWLHIFRLRCSPAAHPQMREIMVPLLEAVKQIVPVIFDDVSEV